MFIIHVHVYVCVCVPEQEGDPLYGHDRWGTTPPQESFFLSQLFSTAEQKSQSSIIREGITAISKLQTLRGQAVHPESIRVKLQPLQDIHAAVKQLLCDS